MEDKGAKPVDLIHGKGLFCCTMTQSSDNHLIEWDNINGYSKNNGINATEKLWVRGRAGKSKRKY